MTMTHDKRDRYSTYYSQAFSFQFEDSDLLAQMVCTILIHTFIAKAIMINQLKMRQEFEEVLNAGRRRHVREMPREIHSTLLARRVPRGGTNTNTNANENENANTNSNTKCSEKCTKYFCWLEGQKLFKIA